jgi:hypothetical protein
MTNNELKVAQLPYDSVCVCQGTQVPQGKEFLRIKYEHITFKIKQDSPT